MTHPKDLTNAPAKPVDDLPPAKVERGRKARAMMLALVEAGTFDNLGELSLFQLQVGAAAFRDNRGGSVTLYAGKKPEDATEVVYNGPTVRR